MRRLARLLAALGGAVALAATRVATAAPPEPQAAPPLRIEGESIWSLRYALGDTEAIPGANDLFGSGVPTFEQQLRL